MKRKRAVIFIVVSLILHALGSWQVMRLLARVEARQHAQAAAALADRVIDVVYLTEPANQIKPSQPSKLGKEHHSVTEETVARPRPRLTAPPQPFDTRKSPVNDPAPRALHAPRLPATAIVRQLGGGLTAHVPEDYFPNFTHGNHTYVNVSQYPAVGYFVEIKQAVGLAWNPLPIVHANLGFFSQYGALKTVLGITIDHDGNLQEKFVLKSSGVAAYDYEALRAFNVSFPFFAPPREVLAIDGRADNELHLSMSFQVYL